MYWFDKHLESYTKKHLNLQTKSTKPQKEPNSHHQNNRYKIHYSIDSTVKIR